MSTSRLKSIDILRALTMLLMIFVNDLWTLDGIPEWLGHKPAQADGMGLADVVFPAFLFIVGLSIPHAIRARLMRGESRMQILRHILERSVSLLIMGVFMVNLEHIDRESLLFSKYLWEILMALGFFLIWNRYEEKTGGRLSPWILKLAGWLILLFLAIIYKGGGEGEAHWMRLYWWGILGLIGWGYLLGALVYLWTGNRPVALSLVLVMLIILNINEFKTPFSFHVRLVVSASNYASVMAGVLVSALAMKREKEGSLLSLYGILVSIALMLMLFGFLTRPLWGISKIRATPSWTAICAAITTLSFLVMHWTADRLKITKWAGIIEPAGSSTLTCYLVPYYVYPIAAMSGWSLPGALTTGGVGIFKSILFSLLIIQMTGILGRMNIRLKI